MNYDLKKLCFNEYLFKDIKVRFRLLFHINAGLLKFRIINEVIGFFKKFHGIIVKLKNNYKSFKSNNDFML